MKQTIYSYFFLKVTYEKIGSLLKLKQSEVVTETQFTALPAKRHYLILHGDHVLSKTPKSGMATKSNSNEVKPTIRIVNEDDTSVTAAISESSSGAIRDSYSLTIYVVSMVIYIMVHVFMYVYQ